MLPETTPQPTNEATATNAGITPNMPTPTNNRRVPTGNAPVDKVRRVLAKIREMRAEAGSTVVGSAEGFRDGIKSVLRFEDPGDAPKENLLIPPSAPVCAVGNYLDGTLLRDARRIEEVVEPLGPATRAAYRTFTRPIPGFHFKETIRHPIRYIANPVRFVTSTTRSASNAVINLIPRSLEEFINRGIKRPLQNLSKIPFVTTLSKIAGGFGRVAEKIREGAEWLTSKTIDRADDWVASKQE